MPSIPIPKQTLTYYDILNLPPSTISSLDPAAAAQLIKRAYRRALLNHHPDKRAPNRNHPQPTTTTTTTTSPPSIPPSPPSSHYTVDQISTAYATLSQPTQRQAYDRSLLLQDQTRSHQSTTGGPGSGGEFQTGIETIDLDDLDYEEYLDDDDDGTDKTGGVTTTRTTTRTRWYRPCRCGNPRGYHVTEADLEDAADLGELMVGCVDCSLWLRVHFAVVDDDDDDDDVPGPGNGNGNENGNGACMKDGDTRTVVLG